jgi:Sporulation lipoprotein YhcN/YlaJ (Spore_YhcN_YlaJ).
MIIILGVLFTTLIFVSGCNKTAQKPQDNTSNSGVQQTSDADNRIMASNFSNIAMGVNGVQKATVVVSPAATVNSQNASANSNSAATLTPAQNESAATTNISASTNESAGKLVVMAGLTLNTAAAKDQNQENQIKEEVKTKIMQSDQRVNEVLVTANADMVKKLQDVAAGVIQGQPIQSYAQDINELDKSIRAQ